MAIVTYNIASGLPPFRAKIIGSSLPENIHNDIGVYQFDDVPNGVYTLQIEDANNCIFEKEITVDPFVSTTTTTIIEDDLLVVGNAQDPLIIFNPNATNRSNSYQGFPDPLYVELYLWLKTLNGAPLETQKDFSYDITINSLSGSTLELIDYSDQIHSNIVRGSSGPLANINGDIELYPGFIEGYFKYVVDRGADDRFIIDLTAANNIFYPNLELTGGTKIYGVTTAEKDRIVMQF